MAYAVQLYFDAKLEASLTRTRSALTAAGVTPTLERLGDRPHVSLAVLEDVPVQRCIAVVEKFAQTQSAFPASFAAFGAFPTAQGVVYLTPTPTAALLEAQRRMHRLLSELGARVHEHYLPESWIPHSTIGFELSNDEVALALSWLHGRFKPLAGAYGSIGLIEFAPVKRLAAFELRARRSKVDAFVSRAKNWQGEIQVLRSILLDCGLDEALKWGKPCFMAEGRNVAIIQPFKEHCSLMFFKGALIQDTHSLLRSQGENTQSAMRLEFTGKDQIKKAVVKTYVKQAIAVEKAGLNVDFKAKRELVLPQELTQILNKDSRLAKAFQALTPGRRRGYVLHFTGAKQSNTRTARIEKCIPRIFAGKGMNDR